MTDNFVMHTNNWVLEVFLFSSLQETEVSRADNPKAAGTSSPPSRLVVHCKYQSFSW